MPQINLGGMTNSASNRLSGISSGLDSAAIIEAAVEAKSAPIRKIEENIEISNKKVLAFSELTKSLNDLRDSAGVLRLAPTYDSINSDVFSKKNIIASSSNGIASDKYAVFSIENNADIESFEIEIVAVAKEKIQQSKSYTSKTDALVKTSPTVDEIGVGTFEINGVTITLADQDSLADIATKINNLKTSTNVQAQIIQPNVGEYRLVLRSMLTGVTNDIVINDATNILNNAFDYDAVKNPNNVIQTAADSQIKFNNFYVNRDSNKIDDFMDGVSISLLNKTPTDVVISVDVIPNKTSAYENIFDFVNKYNALIQFIEQQQERNANGEYTENAVIKNNHMLNELKSDLSLQITNSVNGSSTINNLAEIGIAFEDFAAINNSDDNLKLFINEDKLLDNLEMSYDEVKKLFQYQYLSDSKYITVIKRSNTLAGGSFSVNIDTGRAAAEIAQITANAATFNAKFTPFDSGDLTKGGYIEGNVGTNFYGYKLAYNGLGVDNIQVDFSQGIADQIYNKLSDYLDKKYQANIGSTSMPASLIDIEIYNLRDIVTRGNEDIANKKILIDKYEESLIAKYSKVESNIAQANGLIGMLEAQSNFAGNK